MGSGHEQGCRLAHLSHVLLVSCGTAFRLESLLGREILEGPDAELDDLIQHLLSLNERQLERARLSGSSGSPERKAEA